MILFISQVQFVPKSTLGAFSCQSHRCFLFLCGFWLYGVYFMVPHCHSCTQCAVYAPVALQTPHAVHSSTTSSLLCLFFFMFHFLISNLLLDLFLYGSSESLLKTCLFMSLYSVCMTYYLIVIILSFYYLLFSYGFTEWQSQTQELKNQSTIRTARGDGFISLCSNT